MKIKLIILIIFFTWLGVVIYADIKNEEKLELYVITDGDWKTSEIKIPEPECDDTVTNYYTGEHLVVQTKCEDGINYFRIPHIHDAWQIAEQ